MMMAVMRLMTEVLLMSTNLIYATICIAHHSLSFHGPLNPVPLIGVPYKRVNVNMNYPGISEYIWYERAQELPFLKSSLPSP